MPVRKCPRCRIPVRIDDYSPDTVHECNSGNAHFDNEDVLRLSGQNAMLQGYQNKTEIMRGYTTVTSRGNRVATHETRQHFEYINGGGE